MKWTFWTSLRCRRVEIRHDKYTNRPLFDSHNDDLAFLRFQIFLGKLV